MNRTALRVLAAPVLAATAVVTLGLTPASADVSIGGRTFTTTVNCGGSIMDITSHTAADNGGYVFVYLYDYNRGQWIADTQWHEASAWSAPFMPSYRTSYGYYYVFAYYASWANGQWNVNGEYVTSYRQKSGYSATTSSSCLMGV